MSHIELIVGLGNPGPKYDATRHNVGFWLVDLLARGHGETFKLENKFHGEITRVQVRQRAVWLLKPTTFMNRSGHAVQPFANFYKISPEKILVVHDELDIAPGTVRVKRDGGHGGHNGLRDIITQLGSSAFGRLRIGIGHPGIASAVANYVLSTPSPDDREHMLNVIDESLRYLPELIDGEWQKVMNHLHSIKPAGQDQR